LASPFSQRDAPPLLTPITLLAPWGIWSCEEPFTGVPKLKSALQAVWGGSLLRTDRAFFHWAAVAHPEP